MLFIALIFLSSVTSSVARLDEESHYCSSDGDKLTCLSLDLSGGVVITEAVPTDNELICKAWGPLSQINGLYHKSVDESFTIEKRDDETQLLHESGPETRSGPVSLSAAHPMSPKSLDGSVSVFVANEPDCEIELSALNPGRIGVNWNGKVTEGKVREGYPFNASWSNERGHGMALLLSLNEEPFILAEYKDNGKEAKREESVEESQAEKYWSNARLRDWVAEVEKSRLSKPPPLPIAPPPLTRKPVTRKKSIH